MVKFNRNGCMVAAVLLLMLAAPLAGISQNYTLEISVSNQPDNYILFGAVKGDDFTPLDSSFLYPGSGKVIFNFPEDAVAGTYRVVFGKTPYARIMDEPAQQLNFIFNHENLVFKTDYNEPFARLEIIESNENKAWFAFRSKDAVLQQDLESLKRMLDHYWSIDDEQRIAETANEYNTLQMERDRFVVQAARQNPDLLASAYIVNRRRPISDGYLSPGERQNAFQKEFFKPLEFSDERLINSEVYTDNIFEYLVSYNHPDYSQEQRVQAYMKAVDRVAQNVGGNQAVQQFIMEYMIHGFKVLQLDALIQHITDNYMPKP